MLSRRWVVLATTYMRRCINIYSPWVLHKEGMHRHHVTFNWRETFTSWCGTFLSQRVFFGDVSVTSNSEVPYLTFRPFGLSASGGFKNKDRSVAHILRIFVRFGTLILWGLPGNGLILKHLCRSMVQVSFSISGVAFLSFCVLCMFLFVAIPVRSFEICSLCVYQLWSRRGYA